MNRILLAKCPSPAEAFEFAARFPDFTYSGISKSLIRSLFRSGCIQCYGTLLSPDPCTRVYDYLPSPPWKPHQALDERNSSLRAATQLDRARRPTHPQPRADHLTSAFARGPRLRIPVPRCYPRFLAHHAPLGRDLVCKTQDISLHRSLSLPFLLILRIALLSQKLVAYASFTTSGCG